MKNDLYLFLIYGIVGFFGLIVYFTIMNTFFMFVAAAFLIMASVIHFRKYKLRIIKENKARHVKILD